MLHDVAMYVCLRHTHAQPRRDAACVAIYSGLMTQGYEPYKADRCCNAKRPNA
jgi:hypothetical protein